MTDATCSRCGLPPKLIRRIEQPSPYAMYLNGIPLDQNPGGTPKMRAEVKSFVYAMENELLDCDADIARIEDLLRLLEQERQAGESFVTQHKCILSRVHALPAEITLEIFRYCLDEGSPPLNRLNYTLLYPSHGAIPIPWILSAVCRRWRNILRESPSCWSSLRVFTEDRLVLDRALQFSQDTPLHFDLCDVYWALCLPVLVEHATRWQSVHISGGRKSFVNLDQLGRLPILEKLCITLEARWHEHGYTFYDDASVLDITAALLPFSDCPQLDELFISTGHQEKPSYLEIAPLSIPWANLSKLTMVFGAGSSHVVRSLLSGCTNLRQLNVSGTGSHTSNTIHPEPLLIHANITSLTLENPLDFIHHTGYSALHHLSISKTAPQEIVSFLSQHHHRVSHFELSARSEKTPEDWDPVLLLLPDVTHFTVHLVMVPSPFWTSLSKSLMASLPNLRKLTIDAHYHLLKFCEHTDIIPLIASRWSHRTLQVLEISCTRKKDWDVSHRPALHAVAYRDLPGAVSRIIEESDTIKALRVFKEEGLDVMINGIPLSDRSAELYM